MKLSLVCVITMGCLLPALSQTASLNSLSDSDRTEIIASALKQEMEAQRAEFKNVRILSRENIESVKPSEIREAGFILLSSAQINERKKDAVIEYVVFKELYAAGGKVRVTLARMSEGRPCFGPAFSREQRSKYEYSRGSGAWVGMLVGRPLPISFGESMGLSNE